MTGRKALLLAAPLLAGSLLFSPEVLRAADSAPVSPRVAPALDRTAGLVEGFLKELSDVECLEEVSQLKFSKSDKVEYQEKSEFDYVVLFQDTSGEPTLTESRLAKQRPRRAAKASMLITNGFSILLLIFHPHYSSSFEFTDEGDESVDGRECFKLHFRHIKGLRSTSVLMLRGREYPLDLEGTADIDESSGAVVRMTAALEYSMEDVGLRSLRTEVQYAPVNFQGVSHPYWLPSSAVIDVESPHQHWRNLHRFTSYHRFATSVDEKRGAPK
ncbi:MAG: hypothetical protein LAN62_00640 [Acidobacteriia bacterium]|nr:hypothetical protein [Terriglobia bacterium]